MPASSAECIWCSEPSPLFIEARDLNQRCSNATFSYYRCPECRLIFLNPVPADLGAYYPSKYYDRPSSIEELAARAERDRFKLDLIRTLVPNGRLLEIGPSYGAFAYLARSARFEVHAIESDPACCEFLRNVVGINAINSSDPATALPVDSRFDVIALWHSLEHLPGPRRTLEAMVNHLSPNGVLFISTPNPDSIQFRLFRSRWAHLDAPRHLQLIPVDLLDRQLGPMNLRRVASTTNDPFGLVNNCFGWYASLANATTQRARRATWYAGRAINKVVIPLERSGWRGSAYTVGYRKLAIGR
jgi:SAM-dependent methyltransferase